MALQESAVIQRIAVKMICAADLLQKISTQLATDLETSERKVARYIYQTKLLLSWKRGNAVVRMFGSTVKTVGVVAVVASSLNPKYRTAITVGEKMWKLGASLKILSYVANIIKEMWQKGCRESLLSFMRHTSLLVRNVSVLDELVSDVRRTIGSVRDGHRLQTADEIWNVVSSFIPDKQGIYIHHIINLVLSSQNYSTLFDFAALISDPSNNSNVVQLMREIESIQFLNFVQENDSTTLVAIGSFLHVTRELVDFLDNFSNLRDNDCVFLQQCLVRFDEESKKIRPIVLFLKDMNSLRTNIQSKNLRLGINDKEEESATATSQILLNGSENSFSEIENDTNCKVSLAKDDDANLGVPNQNQMMVSCGQTDKNMENG